VCSCREGGGGEGKKRNVTASFNNISYKSPRPEEQEGGGGEGGGKEKGKRNTAGIMGWSLASLLNIVKSEEPRTPEHTKMKRRKEREEGRGKKKSFRLQSFAPHCVSSRSHEERRRGNWP